MFLFTKDYWKYFFGTYKKAKWLVLRYVVVAIYLSVSSIIANKLSLANLTYYNAIVTILTFADLIGYGTGNAFGLYINHNLYSKDKRENYAKAGLYTSTIVTFLFVIILMVFKKFILHTILGLDYGIDYTFYYIMLFVVFIRGIKEYLTNIVTQLEIFNISLVNSLTSGISLILGFLIAWKGFDLSLVVIAITYIIEGIAVSLVCVFALRGTIYKNNPYKIDLFKNIAISLTKEEVGTLFRVAIIEVVWEVGYFFSSLFLLKYNETIFNQYAYYENILDIFNGFLFSFIMFNGIEISRSLGERNFDKGYKLGKYSIASCIIIWLFYVLLSFAFSKPIISGMNKELQDSAFLSMALYVLLHLFRFVSWNYFSYVLNRGGEVKFILISHIIAMVYYILIYIFASSLPDNIYLAYGMLAIVDVINIITGSIIFKKKKWIKSVKTR